MLFAGGWTCSAASSLHMLFVGRREPYGECELKTRENRASKLRNDPSTHIFDQSKTHHNCQIGLYPDEMSIMIYGREWQPILSIPCQNVRSDSSPSEERPLHVLYSRVLLERRVFLASPFPHNNCWITYQILGGASRR